MASEQHTPGPWTMDERGSSIWGTSVGGCNMKMSEHKIADIRGWGHLQYHGEEVAIATQKANGSLIAAAPDLLWFAQQFFNGTETGLVHVSTDADETWANVIARGRAAIAKATA